MGESEGATDQAREPLDGPTASTSFWTTANASEAMPGICTPLNWSWYGDATEMVLRNTFYRLGVLAAADLRVPEEADERIFSVFHGRVALNLDRFRQVADRTPGTSGDSVEQQIFGHVRDGVTSKSSYRRYPVVAWRLPKEAIRVRRQVLQDRQTTERWWRTSVEAVHTGDVEQCLRLLRESIRLYEEVVSTHTVCTMLTQGIYQQLCELTDRACLKGLEKKLVTGYGAFEETLALERLWAISRGDSSASIDGVLNEFGYVGAGEISAHSWREDPEAVAKIVERFRTLPSDRSVPAMHKRQRAERQRAEVQLLHQLPRWLQPKARILMAAAAQYTPTREIGRASLLMCLDVGRAAARRVGWLQCEQSRLAAPDDVFMFSMEELEKLESVDVDGLVRSRQARRAEYLAVELPETWTGIPLPLPTTNDDGSEGATVQGIGVTGGVVTGTARRVDDPLRADDFSDGEILVCSTTDPSWASLFLLASAVVIDIGGPLSHGAIVARELGLPCVIGTKDGTRHIRDGDVITVDSGSGTVTIERPRRQPS